MNELQENLQHNYSVVIHRFTLFLAFLLPNELGFSVFFNESKHPPPPVIFVSHCLLSLLLWWWITPSCCNGAAVLTAPRVTTRTFSPPPPQVNKFLSELLLWAEVALPPLKTPHSGWEDHAVEWGGDTD